MSKRPFCTMALMFVFGVVLAKVQGVLGLGILSVMELIVMIGLRKKKLTFYYFRPPGACLDTGLYGKRTILFRKTYAVYTAVSILGFLSMTMALKDCQVDLSSITDRQVSVTGRIYKKDFKNEKTILYLSELSDMSQEPVTSEVSAMTQTSVKTSKSVRTPKSQKEILDPEQMGNLMVYSESKEDYPLGTILQVTGKLKVLEEARNPGQFDQKAYYAPQQIYACIFAGHERIVEKHKRGSKDFLPAFKQRWEKSLDQVTDKEDASILKAMVTGNKSELDPAAKELYQKNGIAHILSISGLHISMTGMFIYRALRKLGLSFAKAGTVCILVMSGYGVLTGLGTSTMRALIMFILAIGAEILGRSYDMATGIALACVMILLDSPLYLYQAGFLLSFGAVLGIALLLPIFEHYLFCRHILWKAVSASLSVQLMTLPILLYFFFEISVYSLILNLIVIPLMSYVLLSGMAGSLMGMFFPALGRFFIGTSHYILNFFEILCTLFERLPFALIITGRPGWFSIIGYYLGLLLFLILGYRFIRLEKKAEETLGR